MFRKTMITLAFAEMFLKPFGEIWKIAKAIFGCGVLHKN